MLEQDYNVTVIHQRLHCLSTIMLDLGTYLDGIATRGAEAMPQPAARVECFVQHHQENIERLKHNKVDQCL